MQKLGFIVTDYLAEKANLDERIWVFDADLADSNGAESFIKTHSSRYIAAGIAEQNMISIAAGMATLNRIPFVYSFSSFLVYQAFNQIRTCISQTSLPVILVGSHAGGCCGKNGKTHTALSDIALMRSLPNFSIWAPCNKNDIAYSIDTIIKEKKPAYIRLPRDTCNVPFQKKEKPFYWIGKPSSVALISYGYSTQWAYEAQQTLKKKNIHIGILHFNRVSPISCSDIKNSLNNVKTALILEDHYTSGGLFSSLNELSLSTVLHSRGWHSSWSGQSGETEELKEQQALSTQSIINKLLKLGLNDSVKRIS